MGVGWMAAMLAVSGLLAGCAVPLGSAPQPTQAAVDACNTRADEVFLRQNRDALYRADRYSTQDRDSPFGASGVQGQSAGLSDQFARGKDVQACLNGVATPLSPQPAATAGP